MITIIIIITIDNDNNNNNNRYPDGPNDPQELLDAKKRIGELVAQWVQA